MMDLFCKACSAFSVAGCPFDGWQLSGFFRIFDHTLHVIPIWLFLLLTSPSLERHTPSSSSDVSWWIAGSMISPLLTWHLLKLLQYSWKIMLHSWIACLHLYRSQASVFHFGCKRSFLNSPWGSSYGYTGVECRRENRRTAFAWIFSCR